MSNPAKAVKADFFTSATRMSLSQVKKFITDVLLTMDPMDAPGIMLWGAPGIAKTAILEQIFANHEKGLLTVIASQISALDSNGLPHITKMTVLERDDEGNTVQKDVDVTEFTPTKIFGRGQYNVFLDELNNSIPSTMAALQNMASAKEMGGDKFNDVFLLAACNPPSTNSLANDLNHPTVSRFMHIVVDYTLDDFIKYAMETGKIHPAIVAFHKKTSGQYLQANWEVVKNHGYQVPEPTANEPFPCPRTWTFASNFLNAMAKTGKVEYSLLQPIVEGCVGILAASQFATTYAYMHKLPDIDQVWSGALNSKGADLKGEVAVEYLTAFAAINYAAQKIDGAKGEGMQCRMPKDGDEKKTPAWHLLAGIHRLIQFVSATCSPELGQMVMGNITDRIRILPPSFLTAVYSDVDPKNGLTRSKTFSRTSVQTADNRNTIAGSF